VTAPYNGNQTPAFIGLTDSAQEIASITVGSDQGDFAVDTIHLAETPSETTAPEPPSLMLIGVSLASVGAIRNIRFRKSS
jgi:hypothetical protein